MVEKCPFLKLKFLIYFVAFDPIKIQTCSALQNYHLNLSFVKDINLACGKMTRNGRKMDKIIRVRFFAHKIIAHSIWEINSTAKYSRVTTLKMLASVAMLRSFFFQPWCLTMVNCYLVKKYIVYIFMGIRAVVSLDGGYKKHIFLYQNNQILMSSAAPAQLHK